MRTLGLRARSAVLAGLLFGCVEQAQQDTANGEPGAPDDPDGSSDADSVVDSVDDIADANSTDDDGDGHSEDDGDCDDQDPRVGPDGEEACNEEDDDCDGGIDEGLACNDCNDSGCVAWAFYVGDFVASSTELTSFNYGWGFRGPIVREWICLNQAPFSAIGFSRSGCPDCDWSFSTATGATTQTGSYCSDLVPWSGSTTIMDDDIDESWFGGSYGKGVGFATEYIFEGTNTDYHLQNVLFFNYTGPYYDGWYFHAYNLPDYGIYHVYGDASSGQIYQPLSSSYGQYYIYYYH